VIRSYSCSAVWLADIFLLIISEKEIDNSSVGKKDENSSIREKIILALLSVLYSELDNILVSASGYSPYSTSYCLLTILDRDVYYFVLKRIFYFRQVLKDFWYPFVYINYNRPIA